MLRRERAWALVLGLGVTLACRSTAGPPAAAPGDPEPMPPQEAPVTPVRTIEASGPGYDGAVEARRVVAKSLAAHLGQSSAGRALSFSYTGTYRQAGHFARPGQVDAYPIRGRYVLGMDGSRLHHEGTLRPAEGEPDLPTLAVVTPLGTAVQDYGRDQARALEGDALAEAQQELRWTAPHAILREALDDPGSLRWLGVHPRGGEGYEMIGFVDGRGQSWSLWLNETSRLLGRVERMVAHPIEGDAVEWIEFSDYVLVGDMWLPRRRDEQRLEPSSSWSRTLELDGLAVEPLDEAAFVLPAGVEAKAPPPAEASLQSVAPGVYVVELPAYDCRSMVVAFADHSVVLEAPLASEAGEAIMAAVRQALPGQPIRYLAMSHHHPHYTAGLRPFVHARVRLLTTPGNQALVESIATRPHRLRPDALQREPQPLHLDLVEGSRVLTDGSTTLELIDVGAASKHTDEYLVFYLPQHKLLFEGDLGWLPSGDADAFTGQRARRLLTLIEGLDREVELVVQSWPLEGQRRTATIEQLRAWAKEAGDG
ncbi:MAG: hypothetical protein KDK70_21865 [Myxococcales bacterium]|nr:hypothetical protein [Myxococcales bacterium]